MFKWLNNKKKENKGFTLVELVIVVAILAILVGILAPQYTKYVERSRKAADAANLDNLVTAVKVAAADQTYASIIPDATKKEITYVITIANDGTTVKVDDADSTALDAAFGEFAGESWKNTTLKSKAWGVDTISASCKVESNGSVTVTYNPANIKNEIKED